MTLLPLQVGLMPVLAENYTTPIVRPRLSQNIFKGGGICGNPTQTLALVFVGCSVEVPDVHLSVLPAARTAHRMAKQPLFLGAANGARSGARRCI